MVEDEAQAKQIAYEAARLPRRIALVAPRKFEALDLTPHSTIATLISETITKKGDQQVRRSVRCRTPIYVYNVSKQPAFQGEIIKPIAVPDDRQGTTVMRIHCPTHAIPQDHLEKNLIATIKTELQGRLEAATVVDLWNWKGTHPDEAVGLARVPTDQVVGMLKLSGQGGLWIETPLSKKHLYGPLWLGKPQERIELDQAKSQAAKLANHHGLIRKIDEQGSATYAIRVLQTELTASRETLQLDTKQRRYVQGPPAHIGTPQIQERLQQLKWEATVGSERRWFRGKPTWQITAAQPPPCNETHVQLGYERCWLRIVSARKQLSPVEHVGPKDEVPQPTTWNQATRAPPSKAPLSATKLGKGSGAAPATHPTSEAPPGAPASGDSDPPTKRMRRSSDQRPSWPTNVGTSQPPPPRHQEHLQNQVNQLESTVRRLEALLNKLTETPVFQHPH